MRSLRVLLVMLTVSVSRISAWEDGKTTTLSGADTTTGLINGE
jgi:hypothetical protein